MPSIPMPSIPSMQFNDDAGKVQIDIVKQGGTESVEIDLWLFHDKLVAFNDAHRELLQFAFGGSDATKKTEAEGVGQEGDNPTLPVPNEPDADDVQEAMDRYNRAHDAFFVANGFPSGLSYRSRNQIAQFVLGEVARQKKDLLSPRVTSPPAD